MHDSSLPRHAELACEFLLSHLERKVGRTSRQGRRVPPLVTRSQSPAVRIVAEQRLYRVPSAVAEVLVAWADGLAVELFFSVPGTRRVLELQAEGRRCVSLLPPHESPRPHEDALAFLLHDLCHLAKFVDPQHYTGQVGFFALTLGAMSASGWPAFGGRFDQTFQDDLAHVIADMNGSAIFLFAALKMKLKMAARRRAARLAGNEAPASGPLTPGELAAYHEALEEFLYLFDLDRSLNDAAARVSTRRDHPDEALRLLGFFRAIGSSVLQKRWGSALGPTAR
jgi:hypothetical protein